MMLDPALFLSILEARGTTFFCGVPDSLLASFCAALPSALERPDRHIVAANEGNALALAAGHYLASGKPGLVYLQNSGLGNIVNPLLSLTDPAVYGIPALLLIGWRGEPGGKDEPQHVAQGRLTPALLEALEIPYMILPDDIGGAEEAVDKAIRTGIERKKPYALLVRKNTFAPTGGVRREAPGEPPMSREEALNLLLSSTDPGDVVVSTTGMLSRELFELRAARKNGHETDFLTVGSMGHCSSIALGICLSRPKRRVWALDGDGSMLMHLGALGVIAAAAAANFRHVVFNNRAHDSVGGLATVAGGMNLPAIAGACGYKTADRADSADSLSKKLDGLKTKEGPAFLEVVVRRGARKDLGRPTLTPEENRNGFMRFVARMDET